MVWHEIVKVNPGDIIQALTENQQIDNLDWLKEYSDKAFLLDGSRAMMGSIVPDWDNLYSLGGPEKAWFKAYLRGLDMLNNKIENLGAPVAPTDGARFLDTVLGIKIGFSTRNASGTQAISGIGFTPRIVIFSAFGSGGTHQIFSQGYDDGTTSRATYFRGDTTEVEASSDLSTWIVKTTSHHIKGVITSMDEDGFTITWTLVGTMTAYFTYVAIK